MNYFLLSCILKVHFQFCFSKVKMGDESDKQLNLENFVFDEENHEQK